MEKKGFTLAEILGVVVIIGLLLLLIVPTVINRLNSSKDDVATASEDIIYNAADQYIKEHPEKFPPGKAGRYCIAIQDLITDGKLTEPVIDPSTNDDISDKSVMVTIYSSGNTDFEIRDGNDCKALSSMPFIDFEVTPNGSSWVPKRTVKIIFPKTDGDYKARYRIDNGDWVYIDNIDSKNGGTYEIIFDESAVSRPLQAQYIGLGEESDTDNIINSKINIVNIDSVAPTCILTLTGTMGDNDWYKSNVNVNFGKNNGNLKDNLSGIADYGINITGEDEFGKINSQIQTVDTDNITYYGYVKDKAGNIGKCNISFKKDATKPTCTMTESGTKGNNNWYRSNVTFKVVNDDNLSGVAEYGMNNKNTVRYDKATQMILSADTKSITYYGFVKDNAGNTNTCSRTVKRDVTAPTCKPTKSNQYTTGGVTVKYSCSDATSNVVSCPNTRNNLKSSISAVTIYDNAGNSGTCAAQTINHRTEYRRKTRKVATCTKECCGKEPYEYACGSMCNKHECIFKKDNCLESDKLCFMMKVGAICGKYAGYSLYSSKCLEYKTYYCTGYKNKQCTVASCCGYTNWSGWSGWSTSNNCNSNTCKAESRVVYY